MKGWVYVISNRAMPGLIKIGFSTKDPVLRARELNHTGSPHPYDVQYEMIIKNPREIEHKVHRVLLKYREGKEWFKCSVEEAVFAIRQVVDKDSVIYESITRITDSLHDGAKTSTVYESTLTGERTSPDSSGKFRFVQGVKTTCTCCGASYTITLTRYEVKSACPVCRTHHPVDIDWR